MEFKCNDTFISRYLLSRIIVHYRHRHQLPQCQKPSSSIQIWYIHFFWKQGNNDFGYSLLMKTTKHGLCVSIDVYCLILLAHSLQGVNALENSASELWGFINVGDRIEQIPRHLNLWFLALKPYFWMMESLSYHITHNLFVS